jgi:hypothetical protein
MSDDWENYTDEAIVTTNIEPRPVYDYLIELGQHYIDYFSNEGEEVYEDGMEQFNQPGWVNRVWRNDDYRRAHVDIVDARSSKGIWMMHVCVFPHIGSDAPIYGFDVVASKKLMTGAFHDYSPTTNHHHEMMDYFKNKVSTLQWKRERQLPDWAKAIFSEDMMAAGAVKQPHEIRQVIKTATDTLSYYCNHVGKYKGNSDEQLTIDAQNRYAHFQKQNPHTPRVMKSLGLDENDVELFIQKCLFPEIEHE